MIVLEALSTLDQNDQALNLVIIAIYTVYYKTINYLVSIFLQTIKFKWTAHQKY